MLFFSEIEVLMIPLPELCQEVRVGLEIVQEQTGRDGIVVLDLECSLGWVVFLVGLIAVGHVLGVD